MDTTARMELPPETRSVRPARQFVEGVLTDLGFSDLVDTATLLVSELVTNAVLHACATVNIVVKAARDGVRVEVTDRSPLQVAVRAYDDEASTGRGMLLVEALARSWGTVPASPGKTVWFELEGTAA